MPPKSMRLLVVAEFISINGGENSLLSVLPMLKEFGWQIQVACPAVEIGRSPQKSHPGAQPGSAAEQHRHLATRTAPETLLTRLEQLNIPTVPLATHDVDGQRLSQTDYRSGLEALIRQQSPDVVLCNSLSTSRLCGPVTRSTNVSAVGYLRDIIRLSKTAISDINQMDQLIAVSQATKDFHVGQGLDSDRTIVIRNGVDLQDFSVANRTKQKFTQSIRDELTLPHEDRLILFVGQIGIRKGVDVLIEAFGRLLRRVPNSQLLIVGQRQSGKGEAVEYERRCTAASKQDNLRGRVHWLGRRTDVADLMAQSDLLLHPARQEPLGRVILEAAASGLPVVTTLVGGSREILGCLESYDLMCAADDAVAMADRACDILTDPPLWNRISKELAEMAVRRFDRRRCFQELNSVLKRMALSKRSN